MISALVFLSQRSHSPLSTPIRTVDRPGGRCSKLLEHWIGALLTGDPTASSLKTSPIIAYDLINREVVTAFTEESCRTAAERMAQRGIKRLPVVHPDQPTKLVGIVTLGDLLKARQRTLEEEAKRERFFGAGVRLASDRSAS